MDRIILPYGSGPQGPPMRPHASHAVSAQHAAHHVPTKGPSDYIRSLRRRFWLAVLVTSSLLIVGSVAVLRQKPVFRTEAVVRIEPPQTDTILGSIISEGEDIRLDASSAEHYESNQLASLTNPELIDQVLQDTRVQPIPPGQGEVVRTLVEHFRAVQIPRSTLYNIRLEGSDPAWITKVLGVWLERFEERARTQVTGKIQNSKTKAVASIRSLEGELASIDQNIQTALEKSPVLSPDGENMLVRKLELLGAQRLQKLARHEELLREVHLAQLFPRHEVSVDVMPGADDLDQLHDQEQYWIRMYDDARRKTKKWRSDPNIRSIEDNLRKIQEEIDGLQGSRPAAARPQRPDSIAGAFQTLVDETNDELNAIQREEASLLRQIQSMAPDHSRFLALLSDRDDKSDSISELRQRLAEFELVADTQNRPVTVEQKPTEPILPVAPNKPLYLAFVGLLSIACGTGLALLLEHLDHSVRAPDQLTAGLALPLLAVIPRIRRTARVQRGGHLWTAAAPYSVEADAFRNLRASLVGLTVPGGRSVNTMLITSAKADEGKSTTALNLAATCARSGERTLLLDVDLRRSSLRDVFDEGRENDLGLVDVLRGELPWERTVLETDIPGLDFLPTGNPSGIPVELLGAMEMRQLLLALSDRYDRVILDGPAILGLADCRMLGRVVDATILVVRGGVNDLRPVLRAKAMLDQSRVRLVGAVFNGLADDGGNWWTNYGTDELGGATDGLALPHGGREASRSELAAISAD